MLFFICYKALRSWLAKVFDCISVRVESQSLRPRPAVIRGVEVVSKEKME